jgi:hypothetical protein
MAPDTQTGMRELDWYAVCYPSRAFQMIHGEPPLLCHRNRRGSYPYKRLAGWTQDEYRAFRKKKSKKSRSDRRISQKAAKERRRAFARDQRRNHG